MVFTRYSEDLNTNYKQSNGNAIDSLDRSFMTPNLYNVFITKGNTSEMYLHVSIRQCFSCVSVKSVLKDEGRNNKPVLVTWRHSPAHVLFCTSFFFLSYPVFPGLIHILSVLWIFYANPVSWAVGGGVPAYFSRSSAVSTNQASAAAFVST